MYMNNKKNSKFKTVLCKGNNRTSTMLTDVTIAELVPLDGHRRLDLLQWGSEFWGSFDKMKGER